MRMSGKQAVMAVTFSGLERIPKEQKPDVEMIMEWSVMTDYTELANRRMNRLNVALCKAFMDDGRRACIIKGTSMGVLYPEPLRRDVGDVDVWMAGGYDDVSEYLRGKFSGVKGGRHGHHLSVKVNGVSVEVHFVPAELYASRNNRRLRSFFREIELSPWDARMRVDGGGCIVVPEPHVELVIAVVHIFHHWAFEGIGMKQVLDCYWLLKYVDGLCGECGGSADDGSGAAGADDAKRGTLNGGAAGTDDAKHGTLNGGAARADEIRGAAMALFQEVGIATFVAALMYVMQQLGMDKSAMLCVPNVKYGERLLDDIMNTGVVSAEELAKGRFGKESKPHKFFRRLRRVLRMMPMAPVELPCMLMKNTWGWVLGRMKRFGIRTVKHKHTHNQA